MARYLFILGFCLFIISNNNAQNIASKKHADSIEVANQLKRFVTAFEYLNFDQFQTFFADDVTVFFPPSAMVANRIDGKEKVMDVFKLFFQKIKEKKTNPPYLDITPKKLEINIYQDIAIATFALYDDDALSRRTMILKKIKLKFLIIHMHASKIDNPK
jgi:hypothetical protein